jgi:hypothetical protein
MYGPIPLSPAGSFDFLYQGLAALPPFPLLASDGGIDYRCGLGGLRSLAAAAGRKPTSFHGADGADALQFLGIGQPWP